MDVRYLLLCTCGSCLVLTSAEQGWRLHLAAVLQQHFFQDLSSISRACDADWLPWHLQGRQELLDDIMSVLIQLAASKQFASALASSVSREITDALEEDLTAV